MKDRWDAANRKGVDSGPDFKWVLPLGTGRTAAPRGLPSFLGPHPTFSDGSKSHYIVGNLGLIALLKILWNFGRKEKKS